ncbi:MAG: AI-2E family transporter [Planctomycetales bacterium]|nr:AI-2E family transporter [Planctomycetales bacterium]
MSRFVSFIVLIAIIVVIGLLFYKVLVGFFVPVFLATVLVVVFRPLHHWVLQKTGHRDWLAAGLTTLLIVLLLALPLGIVGGSAAIQGLKLLKDNNASVVQLRLETIRKSLGLQMPSYAAKLDQIEKTVDQIADRTVSVLSTERDSGLVAMGANAAAQLNSLRSEVETLLGPKWQTEFDELIDLTNRVGKESEDDFVNVHYEIAIDLKSKYAALKTQLLGGQFRSLAREYANPTTETINSLRNGAIEYLRPRLLSITGATGAYLVKLIFSSIILIVATFFFLYDGPAMIKTVMYLSPLDDAYEQELLLEFDRISRAVVLATVLSAVVQGLTAGLGYYVAGMDLLLLLVMLTTVFAMVPFVGPAAIWVPVCLYLGLYEGRVLAACLLACWGVAVVGTVDNLVKAAVLHGQSQLHPLLALLSVLGGVQTLGPVGIVVGPMVVALLQTLLSILQRELMHFDQAKLILNTENIASPKSEKKRRTKVDTSNTPSDSPAGVSKGQSEPKREEQAVDGNCPAPQKDDKQA